MCWPAGILRGASPKMILHSIPAGRSIVGVSTGLRGKLGTRHRTLEINAAPRSPGTLAPSVMTVETRLLTDLRKFSSASATSEVTQPTLSREIVEHRVMVLSEVLVSLDPRTGHLGTDLLLDSPHVSRCTSALDLVLHRVNGFDGGLLQALSHQPRLTCVGVVGFLHHP